MSEQPFTGTAFRGFLREGKLMGSRCTSCGALHLPPRGLCPACYGEDLQWTELSGRGTLKAFTSIHIGPSAMIAAGYSRQNPYCTGIVQLEEGPAISAQIVGVDATRPDQIVIGTPLRALVITRGEGEEARAFLAFEVDGE
jgi:uncharacterized OB-fold protein